MTLDIFTADDLTVQFSDSILPVTVMLAVEIVFGIIGNILILIVYCRWYKVCNFRCFVLSMAFIDLLSSVTTLPGEIYSERHWYVYKSVTVCKAKSFFNVFTVWASALVLFLLAFDRNRKICHPLMWQISNHLAKRLCFGCVIFSAIVSSPTTIFWGIQKYNYVHGNTTIRVSICEKSETFADGNAPFIFIISGLVAPTALIMFVTVIFNVCTGHKLLMGMSSSSADKLGNGCVSLALSEEDNTKIPSLDKMCDNDDEDICSRPKRRFSFPTGRHTFRREQFEESKTTTTTVKHHLVDIPETDLPSFSKIGRITIIRKLRTRSHTSQSDADIRTPSRARQLDLWRRRVLRHKLRTRRRKTMIMMTLSTVFIVTTSVYLILICFVATTDSVLRHLTEIEKVIYFFFLRLYFINALINPLLYGVMDLRFRKGLKRLFCYKKKLYGLKTRV